MFKSLSIKIPPEPLYILHQLQKNGFEAYIVGGAVRDTLIDAKNNKILENSSNQLDKQSYKIKASDFDFTTSATPEEIQKLFPENFYENNFGTVGVTKTHLHEQIGLDKIGDTQISKAETLQKDFNLSLDDQDNLNDKSSRNNQTINLSSATKIHQSLQKENSIDNNESKKPEKNKEEIYEITTFRSDGEYKDHRRPEDVVWGETLESDLSRRDFTINAMAIKISSEFLSSIDYKNICKLNLNAKLSDNTPDVADSSVMDSINNKLPKTNLNTNDSTITIPTNSFEIIDLHKGLQDLETDTIKTVGNPNKRFNEDALRVLRAIRFSVQLNMQIDDQTFESIVKNANLIKHISWERIRDEFLKMIKSSYPREAIKILDETGLLKIIIPELLEGKHVMQAGHHVSDVWNHNLDALAECPSNDTIVRLATLLHDVAKPHTMKMINGQPTFYNHEVIGSRIAKNIAKRLKLSKNEIDKIFILVRYHMFYYQPENSDASIRRFMRKVGLENINDILDLREADRLGSGARKTSWRLEEMKQRMVEQLHQPFSIGDLNINGNDLMKELEIKPGRIIGEILNSLFEKVLEKPEMNTREILLEETRNIMANFN